MAAAPPTITQIKEHFVSSQILHLTSSSSTALLTPSPAFQAANERSDQPLEPRHIQPAVAAVEAAVQAHCRRIFVPQANRAVAEQISDTYTRDAERRLRQDGEDDGGGVEGSGIGRELDLADAKTINTLPTTWPSEKDVTAHPMEAKRYTDSLEALTTLQSEREDLRLRVQRLRHLKSIVNPLRTGDTENDEEEGGRGVQENIVTRGGAMEKELERMRMLLVRVAGRVETLPTPTAAGRDGEGEVEAMSVLRKRDLDSFLADSKVFPGP